MNDKAMRQRIAVALGRQNLSEEEYAKLDVKKALEQRRVELKAVKDGKPIP